MMYIHVHVHRALQSIEKEGNEKIVNSFIGTCTAKYRKKKKQFKLLQNSLNDLEKWYIVHV